MSSSRHSGVRAVLSPGKAEKSTTLESTPRMFASPRYQDRVSGTPETSGSREHFAGIVELEQPVAAPACTPSRDVGSASVCASRSSGEALLEFAQADLSGHCAILT